MRSTRDKDDICKLAEDIARLEAQATEMAEDYTDQQKVRIAKVMRAQKAQRCQELFGKIKSAEDLELCLNYFWNAINCE